MNEYFKKGALRSMSEQERASILDGLKRNWDELHQQYQSLSVVIDTIPKRMKKEKLENDMKTLEKDIELLQRHQLIYIADWTRPRPQRWPANFYHRRLYLDFSLFIFIHLYVYMNCFYFIFHFKLIKLFYIIKIII